MKEIQGKSRREGRNTSLPKNARVGDGGKSVLVRVRARFELAGGASYRESTVRAILRPRAWQNCRNKDFSASVEIPASS